MDDPDRERRADGEDASAGIEFLPQCGEAVPVDLLGMISEIYVASFPASERVPLDGLAADVERGACLLCTAVAEHRLVGFTFASPLDQTNVHLLMYMAVARGERGKGIGTRLLRYVAEQVGRYWRSLGLLIEVESDDSAGDQEKQDLRRRRIAFYCRNGAEVIDCVTDYRIPDLSRGGDSEIRMKLLWLPIKDRQERPEGILLQDCIHAILVGCYGLHEGDDLLVRVLESVVC